ncbi:50S ribosomal protein L21 [Candidatus Dojkabacteria bacterium]|nr:50S ribosomal protein L21 [Candidatus Dojkabacteria bacterium]
MAKTTEITKKVKKEEKSTDYAIVKMAGKQFKVSPGQELEVNKIDAKKGDKIDIDDVLLVKKGDKVQIGKPVVDGAKVTFEVLGQKRGEKVRTFKYKAKSRSRKTRGSRQHITQLKVLKIQ